MRARLVAEVVFAIPGDVDTPTGGYRYDRRVIDELRALRWNVMPLRLPGDFPAPSQASLQETERLFTAVPADVLLMVDGLAFGTLPASLLDRVPRKYVALVHHPLALETGVARGRAGLPLPTQRARRGPAGGGGGRPGGGGRSRAREADGGCQVQRFGLGERKSGLPWPRPASREPAKPLSAC